MVEITPENAVQVANEYLSGELETDTLQGWAQLQQLVAALVARIEALERDNDIFERAFVVNDTENHRLVDQRDAAVAVLREISTTLWEAWLDPISAIRRHASEALAALEGDTKEGSSAT